jgi:hypothetical protein
MLGIRSFNMITGKILLSILPLLADGHDIFQNVAAPAGNQSNMANSTSSLSAAAAASSSSSYRAIVDGSLYKFENGDLFNHEALRKAKGLPESRVVPYVESKTRQEQIWDFISTFDSYKTSVSYKKNKYGRPTLENFKYLIVPIWWSDVDTTDPAYIMDPNEVINSFKPNQQYYIDMSWGEMPKGVVYEAFDQQLSGVSSVNPSWGETEAYARGFVYEQKYVEGVDYTGICIMYHTSQDGPFSGAGKNIIFDQFTIGKCTLWISL